MQSKPTLLITGAAGTVSQTLLPSLSQLYELVLTDKRPLPYHTPHRFIQADLTDLAATQKLCGQSDIVLHLAANSSTDAPWDSLLTNNIVATANVFEAAHAANCHRVIFASSGHVVNGYPPHVQITPDMPIRPSNHYGASKAWGEALARYYADQTHLSCLCLRLGWVQPRDAIATLTQEPFRLGQIITHHDLARIILAAIAAPKHVQFGIFHAISNNRWQRYRLGDTTAVLGYQPQDDAFALANVQPQHSWEHVLWRLRQLQPTFRQQQVAV